MAPVPPPRKGQADGASQHVWGRPAVGDDARQRRLNQPVWLSGAGGLFRYEHRDRTISGYARAAAESPRVHAMTLPEGLIYAPGFLTEAEERDVLEVAAAVELQPYVLHDTPSRRLVRSFGLALVAGAYDAGPAAPIPSGRRTVLRGYSS
jgi:hypothetical protein